MIASVGLEAAAGLSRGDVWWLLVSMLLWGFLVSTACSAVAAPSFPGGLAVAELSDVSSEGLAAAAEHSSRRIGSLLMLVLL